MARFAYIRVSTGKQTYDRQFHDLNKYFDRMGMSWDGVEVVSEKITSRTLFTQRALFPILRKAQDGDIVYVCQLDRLGRSMVDILELVDFAVKKGVILLTIDNGYQLENKTAMGKLYLGMVSAMAEAEREIRAERCQSGVDSATDELKERGSRMTKRGTIQTHWGNKKGADETKRIMAIAREAAAQARADAVIAWREQSMAYRYACREFAAGKTTSVITCEIGVLFDDFAALHPNEPNPYATPKGCKPMAGTVSKWLREANPLMPAV